MRIHTVGRIIQTVSETTQYSIFEQCYLTQVLKNGRLLLLNYVSILQTSTCSQSLQININQFLTTSILQRMSEHINILILPHEKRLQLPLLNHQSLADIYQKIISQENNLESDTSKWESYWLVKQQKVIHVKEPIKNQIPETTLLVIINENLIEESRVNKIYSNKYCEYMNEYSNKLEEMKNKLINRVNQYQSKLKEAVEIACQIFQQSQLQQKLVNTINYAVIAEKQICFEQLISEFSQSLDKLEFQIINSANCKMPPEINSILYQGRDLLKSSIKGKYIVQLTQLIKQQQQPKPQSIKIIENSHSDDHNVGLVTICIEIIVNKSIVQKFKRLFPITATLQDIVTSASSINDHLQNVQDISLSFKGEKYNEQSQRQMSLKRIYIKDYETFSIEI